MGWSIGYDHHWKRDIGYGVPAFCDHPECHEEIDRGLSYVCGGEPYGGDEGCGLYFCGHHLFLYRENPQRCERCSAGHDPFDAKPDHPRWMNHKLIDGSWAQWRAEHPTETTELARTLNAGATPSDQGAPASAQESSSSSLPLPRETGGEG